MISIIAKYFGYVKLTPKQIEDLDFMKFKKQKLDYVVHHFENILEDRKYREERRKLEEANERDR